MKVFNALLATLVGFICWGLVAVLSEGISPLGKTDSTAGLIFFMPIVLFAAPWAIYALLRGQIGTGLWIGAMSPVLGLVNVAISLSTMAKESSIEGPTPAGIAAMSAGWLVLLAVQILYLRTSQAHHPE